MKLAKITVTLTIATATLAACITTASANHLSSSTQSYSSRWTSAEFIGGFGTVHCSLTVEGTLHTKTSTKTAGALMGFVTRASLGPCATGSATILQASLPWHVRYASFEGTLPRITSISTNAVGVAWQIREPTFGITCLTLSTAASPVTGQWNLTSGSVTSVGLGGSIPCGSFTGSLGGRSTSNSAQTITLI